MSTERDAATDGGASEARYANVFTVGYNAVEFVLDFGQRYNAADRGHAHTRIVTNPSYAKALLATLSESVADYERCFGVIPKG